MEADFDHSKWIYYNDYDNQVRYVLGTKGKKTLICFGINPSTAKPDELDSTLKSVERLSTYNGYDSWIMFNVYPQRQTESNKIHKTIDPYIHKKNQRFIKKILFSHNNDIWVAWGAIIESRPYLYGCLTDIYLLTQNYNCKWFSIGKLTKNGHPHHPLYLSSETKVERFDINNYMRQINKQVF